MDAEEHKVQKKQHRSVREYDAADDDKDCDAECLRRKQEAAERLRAAQRGRSNRPRGTQFPALLQLASLPSNNATNATLPAAEDVDDPDDEVNDPGADPSMQEGGGTDTGPPVPVGVKADEVDGGQGTPSKQNNMTVPPV